PLADWALRDRRHRPAQHAARVRVAHRPGPDRTVAGFADCLRPFTHGAAVVADVDADVGEGVGALTGAERVLRLANLSQRALRGEHGDDSNDADEMSTRFPTHRPTPPPAPAPPPAPP